MRIVRSSLPPDAPDIDRKAINILQNSHEDEALLERLDRLTWQANNSSSTLGIFLNCWGPDRRLLAQPFRFTLCITDENPVTCL